MLLLARRFSEFNVTVASISFLDVIFLHYCSYCCCFLQFLYLQELHFIIYCILGCCKLSTIRCCKLLVAGCYVGAPLSLSEAATPTSVHV